MTLNEVRDIITTVAPKSAMVMVSADVTRFPSGERETEFRLYIKGEGKGEVFSSKAWSLQAIVDEGLRFARELVGIGMDSIVEVEEEEEKHGG